MTNVKKKKPIKKKIDYSKRKSIVLEYKHLNKGYKPICEKYHITKDNLKEWIEEERKRELQQKKKKINQKNNPKKKVNPKVEEKPKKIQIVEPPVPPKTELKKKNKPRWKNIILVVIFLIFLNVFVYSTVKIVLWKIDSNKTSDVIDDVQETIGTDATEVVDNEKTETVNPPADKANLYWQYIQMKLIDVDFTKLLTTNPDTVGWIQVGGTNINYPVVQTTDNTYYLTHSFDRTYNTAGWVFMDYRNDKNMTNKNTILYAHGRYDKTMFGTLKNILTNGWLSDTDNYIIKTSSPKENDLWQIFSIYIIDNTSDYLKTTFSSDSSYNNFLAMLQNRSEYNFNVSLTANDKILTLSTCYNDYKKVVMHAKLIKKETK